MTVGKEPAILACDLPGLINKSNVPRVTFSLDNASGTPLDGKGEYIIYKGKEKVAAAEFEANKAVEIPALRQLPSGKYLLEAEVPGVTDSASTLRFNFMLFALDDKRPADSTEIWTYATSEVIPRDSDVTVQIGTSMHDVVGFYDVIGNGKLLESRQIPMSDTIINLKYRYKEEYGDGVAITFGFMRDGVLYSNVRQLRKPEPDKRLRFKWTTFRNRLQPGKKEEWSLSVYEPDGSPAKASAIAGGKLGNRQLLNEVKQPIFQWLSYRVCVTIRRVRRQAVHSLLFHAKGIQHEVECRSEKLTEQHKIQQ